MYARCCEQKIVVLSKSMSQHREQDKAIIDSKKKFLLTLHEQLVMPRHTPFETFYPHTSIKTIAQHKCLLYPSTYQPRSFHSFTRIQITLLIPHTLILKCFKIIFTIPPLLPHPFVLKSIHVLLILPISLSNIHLILKLYPLIFEPLVNYITYALFHRNITKARNPLLAFPLNLKFTL